MASTSASTLDDLISSTTPNSNPIILPPRDDHLFYPSIDDEEPAAGGGSTSADQHPRQLLKDRLYIGNLHPSVDEYTLLQVFSKFGKVTKLDYLFHKTGLLKGKPRGYAFIEYADKDDALKALTMAHEKPLRGRKLVVTFAQQAPLDQYGGIGIPSSLKNRKTMMDTGRPTTLSMLKTGMSTRHEGKTRDKIAMMEAKLRQMERTNPRPTKPSTPPSDMDMDMDRPLSLPVAPSSSLPFHPSLPAKPPPVVPGLQPPVKRPSQQSQPTRPPQMLSKPKPPAPSLSIPSSLSKSLSQGLPANGKPLGTAPLIKSLSASATTGPAAHQRSAKPNKLVGVKIKAKEKEHAKS